MTTRAIIDASRATAEDLRRQAARLDAFADQLEGGEKTVPAMDWRIDEYGRALVLTDAATGANYSVVLDTVPTGEILCSGYMPDDARDAVRRWINDQITFIVEDEDA